MESETIFPQWISVSETARMIRASNKTVRKWIDRGIFSVKVIEYPGRRHIRVSLESVMAFLSNGDETK